MTHNAKKYTNDTRMRGCTDGVEVTGQQDRQGGTGARAAVARVRAGQGQPVWHIRSGADDLGGRRGQRWVRAHSEQCPLAFTLPSSKPHLS
jgi:hypothetical protein